MSSVKSFLNWAAAAQGPFFLFLFPVVLISVVVAIVVVAAAVHTNLFIFNFWHRFEGTFHISLLPDWGARTSRRIFITSLRLFRRLCLCLCLYMCKCGRHRCQLVWPICDACPTQAACCGQQNKPLPLPRFFLYFANPFNFKFFACSKFSELNVNNATHCTAAGQLNSLPATNLNWTPLRLPLFPPLVQLFKVTCS